MQGVRHWAAIFPRTRNARARMSDTLSLHSTSPSSSLLSRALNFPSVLRSMSSCNFSSASDGRRSSAIASIRSRGGLDGGAHGLSFLCSGLDFFVQAPDGVGHGGVGLEQAFAGRVGEGPVLKLEVLAVHGWASVPARPGTGAGSLDYVGAP